MEVHVFEFLKNLRFLNGHDEPCFTLDKVAKIKAESVLGLMTNHRACLVVLFSNGLVLLFTL